MRFWFIVGRAIGLGVIIGLFMQSRPSGLRILGFMAALGVMSLCDAWIHQLELEAKRR